MTRMTISSADQMYHGKAYYSNYSPDGRRGIELSHLTWVDLGVPDTADADGVCASQSVTVATTPLAVINGALASGGVATFPLPCNVVAAWTGAAVLTVTGTDVYGESLVEASASGTSLTGSKSFKTVTAASFSANVTGATVGAGVKRGLPFRLTNNSHLVGGLKVDGITDITATVVSGVTTASTSTSIDTRGMITPSVVPNNVRRYSALIAITDQSTTEAVFGLAQFAG